MRCRLLELFVSSAEAVSVTYTVANKTFTLDTTSAGYGQAGNWEAVIDAAAAGKLTMDILIDRSSLEFFVGDGTSTVFPQYQESKDIEIVAHGGKASFDSIKLTPLGSCWN